MAGLQTEVLDLEGWDHFYSGKVRDLYVPAGTSFDDTDRVLVVASDRISAYDFVLTSEIPDKGKVLTQLSLWWFEQLGDFGHAGDHGERQRCPAARLLGDRLYHLPGLRRDLRFDGADS